MNSWILFNRITANIIIFILILFRLTKGEANKENPSFDRRKYNSLSLNIDKKTRNSFSVAENKISASRVSIIKGDNICRITSKAIDLLGGLKRIVKLGSRVFIKPNYITGGLEGHDPVASGEIAHPEVVAAVAEEGVEAGAKEVIIIQWV